MATVEAIGTGVKGSQRAETFHRLVGTLGQLARNGLQLMLNRELDAEVTVGLGRGWREPLCVSGDADAPWTCHRCGNRLAREFGRDGHYGRALQTLSGGLVGVQVPMLECKVCGASADIEFAALPKHKQLWLDIDEEILFGCGADEAFRHIGERVGKQLNWPVSASSVQRRVHALGEALAQWRERRWEVPPDVLMIDGIWFTMLQPTAEQYTDKAGRKRKRRRKVKRVAIVVLGLWSKTGQMEILDFVISAGEDHDTVVELLNGIHLRGVTEAHVRLIASDGAAGFIAAIETAYPTVPRQRCVFHKLKNAGDALRDNANRKELLGEAAAIYKAQTADQAQQRLEHFATKWDSKEPGAVSSLRTDFAASVAYLLPLGLHEPRRFRTTNAIEGGVQRRLRVKISEATAFHSPNGAEAALFLASSRINAHQRGVPWAKQTEDLLRGLHGAKP